MLRDKLRNRVGFWRDSMAMLLTKVAPAYSAPLRCAGVPESIGRRQLRAGAGAVLDFIPPLAEEKRHPYRVKAMGNAQAVIPSAMTTHR